MFRYLIVFVTLLFSMNCKSQDCTREQLLAMEDEALLLYFSQVERDSIVAEEVARVYLERGRMQKDTIKMARGYDRLARIFHPEKNIQFSDSLIELTKNMNNITYPGLGYILKGYLSYELDEVNLGNINFFKAYDLAKKSNNITQQSYILNCLAFYKLLYGNKEEALKLQQEQHQIIISEKFEIEIIKSTRSSAAHLVKNFHMSEKIHSFLMLGVCHHYLKNRDSTIYYAKIAEKLIKGYLGENIINHKTLYWELMMEHDYFEKNFKNSQRYADSLINYNDVNSDNGLLMNINLFKGLSYYDDNKKEIGLKYLLISDSIFDFGVQLSLQAQDKILFSTLKNHFASQGNSEMELYYLNKQIKFDSILNLKYEGLESDIIRNIETPQLLAAKNKLIQTLARQKQNAKAKTTLALIGAVILFIILLYYLKKQRIYKKKFKQLIASNISKSGGLVLDINTMEEKQHISSAIVDELMDKLDRFERNQKYLNPNLSLNKLAKDLNTNPNYLSRVINLKMEKNFSQYLNDFRITYAVEELKTNTTFRKYSIKAIAYACGFNSASSFSRVFYRTTGIQPSYYLKKLEQEEMHL